MRTAEVDGAGGRPGSGTDELEEREHELRAALFGIETAATTLDEQRDRLPSSDVDQLVQAIASEARRLRAMLTPMAEQYAAFDLGEAIRPTILMVRAMGVDVRDHVSTEAWVVGRRGCVAQVVLALLDNARVHASGSAIDVHVSFCEDVTTLYIEDRGPGLGSMGGVQLFERGVCGAQSSGSGLGLFIAQRLMTEQGGSLTVAARRGGGSSFALSLPSCLDRQSVGAR